MKNLAYIIKALTPPGKTGSKWRALTPHDALDRRSFLFRSGCALCLCALGDFNIVSCIDESSASKDATEGFAKIAMHWKKLDKSTVQCGLCPNECVLGNGERGACRVRENRKGTLYTLIYSRLAAMHVDPVEKKPFFHFLPGSMAYSVATAGCNFSCKFCQNWELSQAKPEDLDAVMVSPDALAHRAHASSSRIIAFTYNEPTIQYEYIIDASRKAREKHLRPVIVSNGYIRPEAGRQLTTSLDAIKIDLKSFSQKFYGEICGGVLNHVLKNLELVHKSGTWLEIVVLVIPTLNDSESEIRSMARWVKRNLSTDVPMHFTRFQSTYLMRNLPPTPVETLEQCREAARAEGIRYAYVGNVPGHRWENTYCHNCGAMIIRRSGFYAVTSMLRNGHCPHCATRIPGVWV